MSAGFGFSVGDFLAVLRLVGTVIDALHETSGASSSFVSLINELYILQSALFGVKRLDPEVSHVQKVALYQAASQCQRTIETFYEQIKHYQPHLQQLGTASKVKDAWMKIKWATCKKDDVEKFRAEIRGHTSSIEILLLTMQIEATTMYTRNQESQHKSLARGIQHFSLQAMGRLATIAGSITQSVQQGKALLEASAQVIQTNLRIFQMVYNIQMFILKVPAQIQLQQPVYLIDPLNKECPFHLEFIRSPEALLAVLKANLRESGCGPAMIDRGEFAIEELETKSTVDLSGSWESCFFPGQRVAMSMIFKQWHRGDQASCPRCGKKHEESTGKEISCNGCGVIFRRIEEIGGDIQITSKPSDPEDVFDPGNVIEGSVHGPELPREEKTRDDVLINLRKFRRVQMIDKYPGWPRHSWTDIIATESDEPKDRLTAPTLIEWEGAGECIYATGTFAAWKRKYKLHRNGPSKKNNVHSAYVNITPGTHHLSFLVDDNVRTSDRLPMALDYTNILVNYIEVSYDDVYKG